MMRSLTLHSLGQGLESWVDDARTGKTGVGRVLREGQNRPHASGGASCTRPPGTTLSLDLSSMQRKVVKICNSARVGHFLVATHVMKAKQKIPMNIVKNFDLVVHPSSALGSRTLGIC